MANTSATLKNPFEGHEDIKTFREQADSGKGKLNSFKSDVTSKIEAVSVGYAAALEASASNWTSSDNTSKEQLTHLSEASTLRLLTSVSGDLANIIGDVETVSSNIKDIENKYEQAKKYKPGVYMKDGNPVSSGVDGAVWNDRDNEKIIKANQELPDLVQEAEKQVQSIIDAAGAVKLGIDAESIKTGNFGALVAYQNDMVKREKVSGFASTISFIVGAVAGMLNDGEDFVEMVLTAAQSLLGLIPGFDTSFFNGLIEKAKGSDFIDGIISSLVQKFGGDMDAYERGKKFGPLGTIVGCHILGPVGNILYGLYTAGKQIKTAKAEGRELTDPWTIIQVVGSGIGAAYLDSKLLGLPILGLFNTELGTEFLSQVTSGIPLLGALFGGGSGSGIGDTLKNLFSGAGDLLSKGWEAIKGWFSI